MRCHSKLTVDEASRQRTSAGSGSLPGSVEGRILSFLDGATHGEELLHALYDHVLREPIPPAMRALLND